MSEKNLRLGINIDHVATLRNARGGNYPDPIRAAQIAAQAGADGITAHLREDRRHIRDDDMRRLREEIALPLNMEMAATEEMLAIALDIKPHAVCIVPERREELTTEGGLDVAGNREKLAPVVAELTNAGIRVSLFIDAEEKQLETAAAIGAPVVELHTGSYAHEADAIQLGKLVAGSYLAEKLGLECHAGHGLTFENVEPVAAIANIRELNIGHFLIGEAVFLGLEDAIIKMRECMNRARKNL